MTMAKTAEHKAKAAAHQAKEGGPAAKWVNHRPQIRVLDCYMLTGFRNLHPRDAIKHNESPEADNTLAFFDKLVEEQ